MIAEVQTMVRGLVLEERELAEQLERVRVKLGALKKLAGLHTSAPRRRPAPKRAAVAPARPAGRKAVRARRSARPSRPPAPLAVERPVKAAPVVTHRDIKPANVPASPPPAPAVDRLAVIAARAAAVIVPTPAPVLEQPRKRAVKTCSICQQKGHTRQTCGKPRDTKRAARLEAALERRAELEKSGVAPPPPRKRGESSPTGGNGPRVPYLARAHQAEAYYRCRCAIALEGGERNHQADAKVACGALVFGKKLAEHLKDAHELENRGERAAEYFELVDPAQGAER